MSKRIVFVGIAAKQIAKAHRACIMANGKAIVIFSSKPDAQEVEEAFKQIIAADESVQMINGRDAEAVLKALRENSRNILIVRAEELSVHVQMEMQKNRLHGWILLTSRKPEELAREGTPWAISFTRNTIATAIAWRNLNERPRRDVLDQIKATIEMSGVEVPEGLLEDRMAQLSREQIANALEVNSMAEAMIASAKQAHSKTLRAVNVLAGMLLKDTSTASPTSTAASLMEVGRMTAALGEEEGDDDRDHIGPAMAARISRLDGGAPKRRPRDENPKFAIN